MTDEETLALAHDVSALLARPEFHRVFAAQRERLVSALESATNEAARNDLVAELRALRGLRSRFEGILNDAASIRDLNTNRKI